MTFIAPVSFPSISTVPGVSGVAGVMPDTLPVKAAEGTDPTNGFAAVLASSVDRLQAMSNTTDSLAQAAATGDLTDVHDYMIASTQASVATDVVVAVRNKAVEAFNEIMRMPV